MNKERLQEIKDSIDFQREILIASNMQTLCVDEEMELYNEIIRLKKQKDDVVECCKNSIKSVNDRLAWVDTKKSYPNEYQRVRLKAFRTKCKEILRLLGECNE